MMDDSLFIEDYDVNDINQAASLENSAALTKLYELHESATQVLKRHKIQDTILQVYERQRSWDLLKKKALEWRRIEYVLDFVGRVKYALGQKSVHIKTEQALSEYDSLMKRYETLLINKETLKPVPKTLQEATSKQGNESKQSKDSKGSFNNRNKSKESKQAIIQKPKVAAEPIGKHSPPKKDLKQKIISIIPVNIKNDSSDQIPLKINRGENKKLSPKKMRKEEQYQNSQQSQINRILGLSNSEQSKEISQREMQKVPQKSFKKALNSKPTIFESDSDSDQDQLDDEQEKFFKMLKLGDGKKKTKAQLVQQKLKKQKQNQQKLSDGQQGSEQQGKNINNQGNIFAANRGQVIEHVIDSKNQIHYDNQNKSASSSDGQLGYWTAGRKAVVQKKVKKTEAERICEMLDFDKDDLDPDANKIISQCNYKNYLTIQDKVALVYKGVTFDQKVFNDLRKRSKSNTCIDLVRSFLFPKGKSLDETIFNLARQFPRARYTRIPEEHKHHHQSNFLSKRNRLTWEQLQSLMDHRNRRLEDESADYGEDGLSVMEINQMRGQ